MIKRIFYTTLVFIALTMMLTVTASAQEYIVKMKDNGVMLFSTDVEPLYAEINLYTADEETAKQLLENGMVEYIQPDGTVELFGASYEDVYAAEFTKCPALATINASAAWNYETFGDDVTVAVIDSGCYPHTELEGRLLEGKNLIDGSNNTTDTDGHGTHVSGIIAASLNGEGVAGLAPKSKIIPFMFTNGQSGSVSNAIAALREAINNYECDIINMSWGTSDISHIPALKEVIELADSKGIILVAAVGNDGISTVNYPAGFDCVIGVGAVDINKKVCSFSQRNNTVALCAPGDGENYRDGIFSLGLSETEDTKYALKFGTSMACPYVSAAAAVALSFDPTITPAEMKTLLINSTHDATGTYKQYAGAGVLDIELMVQNLLSGREAYTSPLTETEEGTSATLFNLTDSNMSASSIWFDGESLTDTPFTVDANGKTTLTTSLTPARLFIWNSLNGTIPLANSR